MKKHNVRPNPDITEVSSYTEITTTEHTEAQKSIYNLNINFLYSNYEEYDHELVSFLKLDKSQQPISAIKPKSKVTVRTSLSTDRGEL